MLGEGLPQNKGTLYLQNTAGVHYDVVNVNADVVDFPNTSHNYSNRSQYRESLGAASLESSQVNCGRKINT